MKEHKSVSALFYVSGAYDGILGVAFLFFSTAIYQSQQVPPPNHIGYVQFPAALLLVFTLMFFAIAANPVRNRNLIPYGILFKLSYCAVVFGHWFRTESPTCGNHLRLSTSPSCCCSGGPGPAPARQKAPSGCGQATPKPVRGCHPAVADTYPVLGNS
jgi:hypothetical protein